MRVHSLTTRFLLAILLLTTVPFLGFGWYAQQGMREELEQRVVRVYLPEQARNAALSIQRSLDDANRAGWLLASRASQLLAEDPVVQLPRFTELVESTYGLYANFQLIVLSDASGRVLRTLPSPALDAERHDELRQLQPESVADQQWFRSIQRGESEVWVGRHISPYLVRGDERESKDPAAYSLGMAFSVQMPDGALGAMFVLLEWAEVQRVLDGNKAFLVGDAGIRSAEVFLCSMDGQILAHTDRSDYGGRLEPESLRIAVVAGKEGDVAFDTTTGESRHAGYSGPVRHGAFAWCVGLHAAREELFRASRAFGRTLLWVTTLLAVFLAFWAWVLSRAILRPVHRLSEATRRVAQGDLDYRVEARSANELGELGRAFNSMAADLADSQARLRDAERQAAWAEMARQVAHEIKNPLTPMRMGAQLLLKARSEHDPRWEMLADRLARTVVDQTSALDKIASEFRQFAGSPVRDLQPMSMQDLLRGVAELVAGMAEAGAVKLEFAVDAVGESMCLLDRQEMRRVLLNLLNNAFQACGDVGSVLVDARRCGGMVEIRVEDNGPGVEIEAQAKLFEPYFTTKTSGTGLGLAICRRIVEAHGGRIRLEESRPGRTVFLITLPVTDNAGTSAG